MNDDVDFRLMAGFPGHTKTKKLVRRLGQAAAWNLVCLIAYARVNKADGVLTGMSVEEIELAADWQGDPGRFVENLCDIRFLDFERGAYRLHDWADHQPWAMGAQSRSDHGRLAALKRHYGAEKGEEMFRAELARRNAKSLSDVAPSNAQPPTADAPSKVEQGKSGVGQSPDSVSVPNTSTDTERRARDPNVIAEFPSDWVPCSTTLALLKQRGLPEPTSDQVSAFVGHWIGKSIEPRRIPGEFLKWMAREKVFASRNGRGATNESAPPAGKRRPVLVQCAYVIPGVGRCRNTTLDGSFCEDCEKTMREAASPEARTRAAKDIAAGLLKTVQ